MIASLAVKPALGVLGSTLINAISVSSIVADAVKETSVVNVFGPGFDKSIAVENGTFVLTPAAKSVPAPSGGEKVYTPGFDPVTVILIVIEFVPKSTPAVDFIVKSKS